MKKVFVFAALALSLTVARPAHAQLNGCDDSPENPTLILAGLAAGAFGVSSLRTRLQLRRHRRKQ